FVRRKFVRDNEIQRQDIHHTSPLSSQNLNFTVRTITFFLFAHGIRSHDLQLVVGFRELKSTSAFGDRVPLGTPRPSLTV
ncbi:hypothetical protein OFL98_30090, partial [Escherichia coli]|nr:hypothetical protein [Escherichia coli]